MTDTEIPTLAHQAAPYLAFLEGWLAALPAIDVDPAQAAVLVVDLIEGFCDHGNLASPRIKAMVDPVVSLVSSYQQAGGAHVLLAEDAHPTDAREFASFPPHCLAETDESRTVSALAAIESPSWRRFPKQTINGMAEPALQESIEAILAAGVRDVVIAGDCTDLCIYQAALALQLLLNRSDRARYRDARVLVPARAVDTYDLPLEAAAQVGAQPHPGDLLHAIFLHHMALNGIAIAGEVRWRAAAR